MEPDSRLSSKLTGFKNRLMKPSNTSAARPLPRSEDPYLLTQAAVPRSAATGPSPSPLDSAYDFGSLAGDRQEAAQAGTASHTNTAGACIRRIEELHRCHVTQLGSSISTCLKFLGLP